MASSALPCAAFSHFGEGWRECLLKTSQDSLYGASSPFDLARKASEVRSGLGGCHSASATASRSRATGGRDHRALRTNGDGTNVRLHSSKLHSQPRALTTAVRSSLACLPGLTRLSVPTPRAGERERLQREADAIRAENAPLPEEGRPAPVVFPGVVLARRTIQTERQTAVQVARRQADHRLAGVALAAGPFRLGSNPINGPRRQLHRSSQLSRSGGSRRVIGGGGRVMGGGGRALGGGGGVIGGSSSVATDGAPPKADPRLALSPLARAVRMPLARAVRQAVHAAEERASSSGQSSSGEALERFPSDAKSARERSLSSLDAHSGVSSSNEMKEDTFPIEIAVCCICRDAQPSHGLVHGDTCHQCVCRACGEWVLAQQSRACPICRARVEERGLVRVLLC